MIRIRDAWRAAWALAPGATVIEQAELARPPVLQTGGILSFLPGVTVARGEFHADCPVVSTRGFFVSVAF